MKKLFLTLSIAVLLFCSCSNNETNDLQNRETKISAVLNEKNYDTQKIMYRMLSNEDKLQIWQNKIDNMILNDKLNKEQINLIEDLRSNLTAELFDQKKNNDAREIFKSVYVKKFINKAQFLFKPEYFASNFYELNNKVSFDSDKPDCTCNQSSIWSCAMQSNDCQSSDKCKTTSDGCGFLTMSSCNGRCYVR